MTKKVHHMVRKAADKALAEGVITAQSRDAVIEGRMSLATARNIGAEGGPTDTSSGSGGRGTAQETPGRASAGGTDAPQGAPPQPVSRISKDDATQECWCGCGERTKPHRRWLPGHDQRAKGIIKRAVKEGKTKELSDRLREYGAERGLIT